MTTDIKETTMTDDELLPVMRERMQGVDCYWCEDGTPHRHEPTVARETCGTCGGDGQIPRRVGASRPGDWEPCPDCQPAQDDIRVNCCGAETGKPTATDCPCACHPSPAPSRTLSPEAWECIEAWRAQEHERRAWAQGRLSRESVGKNEWASTSDAALAVLNALGATAKEPK